MSQQDDLDSDLEEEPLELEPPGQPPRLTGGLPRLPISRPVNPPQAETESPPAKERAPQEPPAPPAAPPTDQPPSASAKSSPASTDKVSPQDLRAAVRQAADIAFVLTAQGIGAVHSRVKRQPKIAEQWKPTVAERELVLAPAGRIIARHIKSDITTADTVDACLIASGVGAFGIRAAYGFDPLGAENEHA